MAPGTNRMTHQTQQVQHQHCRTKVHKQPYRTAAILAVWSRCKHDDTRTAAAVLNSSSHHAHLRVWCRWLVLWRGIRVWCWVSPVRSGSQNCATR